MSYRSILTMGVENKKSIKSRRKFHELKFTATGAAILLVLGIIYWTPNLFFQYNLDHSLSIWNQDDSNLKLISGETHPVGKNLKFKLQHAFRHGVGEYNDMIQMHSFEDQLLFTTDATFDQNDDLTKEEQQRILEQHIDMYPNHEISLSAETVNLHRMKNRDPDFVISYLDYSLENPEISSMINIEWDLDDPVISPNVSDKDTVLGLALMASNAYVRTPHDGDWRNVTDPWKSHMGHGWDGSGVRGHVFASEDESLVVIALKGTSSAGIPGGGGETETVENDKINDNLLFSCCCARVSYLWTTVCDCYEKSYTCNQRCLERELRRKDRYFEATLDIYRNVSSLYPNSDIWVTGHSLGGSLASFLGRTFGLPTVTFEAPGELLATKRLHLPMPPGLPDYVEGVYHFGHTADPIFIGTCNGASSTCSLAGYAMETSCHSGKVCIYDVVKDKGWSVNMLNHRIHTVIDDVILKYDEPAQCLRPEPCLDCYNWRYTLGDESDSEPEPTSSFQSQTTTTYMETSSTTDTVTESSSCVGRNMFGWCTKYETQTLTLTNTQ